VINGKTICEATGTSKKESQQLVSQIACQQIFSKPDFLKDLLQDPSQIGLLSENNLSEQNV
jgi:hypothetical protein